MSSLQTTIDDARQIEATLLGDREAFGPLVREYQDRLFNSVHRIAGCHAEAEEIVQDAFVQAYTKLNSFRGESGFYTWLYRIAMNLALSRKRRRKHSNCIERERNCEMQEPVDDVQLPMEGMLYRERGRQIQSAMKQLSDDHRSILVLREFEGFDYRTIAGILGINVGSVRSRLHRARNAMCNQLKLTAFDL